MVLAPLQLGLAERIGARPLGRGHLDLQPHRLGHQQHVVLRVGRQLAGLHRHGRSVGVDPEGVVRSVEQPPSHGIAHHNPVDGRPALVVDVDDEPRHAVAEGHPDGRYGRPHVALKGRHQVRRGVSPAVLVLGHRERSGERIALTVRIAGKERRRGVDILVPEQSVGRKEASLRGVEEEARVGGVAFAAGGGHAEADGVALFEVGLGGARRRERHAHHRGVDDHPFRGVATLLLPLAAGQHQCGQQREGVNPFHHVDSF